MVKSGLRTLALLSVMGLGVFSQGVRGGCGCANPKCTLSDYTTDALAGILEIFIKQNGEGTGQISFLNEAFRVHNLGGAKGKKAMLMDAIQRLCPHHLNKLLIILRVDNEEDAVIVLLKTVFNKN